VTTHPRPKRKPLRLPHYDYSESGAYFVTICVQGRRCILGRIVDETTQLSPAGRSVLETWHALPDHFPTVKLDQFVLMPNHVHGILWLTSREDRTTLSVGAGLAPPAPAESAESSTLTATEDSNHTPADGASPAPTPAGRLTRPTLGQVIGAFKSLSAISSNRHLDPPAAPFWQRGYYEHVIRTEAVLNRLREYILDNPRRWTFNPNNPDGRPDAAERAFWKAFSTR
jgi:REP element-mobilizing transposase RayT